MFSKQEMNTKFQSCYGNLTVAQKNLFYIVSAQLEKEMKLSMKSSNGLAGEFKSTKLLRRIIKVFSKTIF